MCFAADRSATLYGDPTYVCSTYSYGRSNGTSIAEAKRSVTNCSLRPEAKNNSGNRLDPSDYRVIIEGALFVAKASFYPVGV